MSRTLRPIVVAIAVCSFLAASASTASAAKSQRTVIEDPARLLSGDPATQDLSLDETKALGAKIVKIPVLWRLIAPNGDSTSRPGGDLSNPASYPAANWAVLDRAIAGATQRGMKVWLMITAPAPRWAVRRESKPGPGAYQPNVNDYKRFATAVGRRYRSVKMYSIWNEPNLSRFLQPQRRGSIIHSAIHYRKLYKAGYDGLVRAGHRRSTILFGELLPSFGNRSSGTVPLTWLRSFFCIDSKGKRLRGRAAKRQKCPRRYTRVKTSGLAYHPYSQAGGPFVKPGKNSAPIAYLKRVQRVLDQATKAKRLAKRRAKIYSSEFGFQSSPPDIYGTSIRKIPYYLNASEYLSWVDSRVATYSQYLIVDDKETSGFQTGLRFVDGQAKTKVYAAFQTPIMVFKGRGNRVTVWGCLRAKAPGRAVAEIQYKSGSTWKTVSRVSVRSSTGYFRKAVRVSRAQSRRYRITWSGGTSRETKPGRLIKPSKR